MIGRRDSTIFVERNSRGGWSIRLDGDDEQLGNYPSFSAAEKIARANCQHVLVLDDPFLPAIPNPDSEHDFANL